MFSPLMAVQAQNPSQAPEASMTTHLGWEEIILLLFLGSRCTNTLIAAPIILREVKGNSSRNSAHPPSGAAIFLPCLASARQLQYPPLPQPQQQEAAVVIPTYSPEFMSAMGIMGAVGSGPSNQVSGVPSYPMMALPPAVPAAVAQPMDGAPLSTRR